MTKLIELVQLSKAFSAEVNVGRDFRYCLIEKDPKIDGYLPNASSRGIIKSVLESLPANTDRKAHLITASYGTGKSYLLLMLGHLLGNNRADILNEFFQKISGKEDYYKDKLGSNLSNYIGQSDPYLIVIPNYAENDFNLALLQGLNAALEKADIDYIPATNYHRAANVLRAWEINHPALIQAVQQRLTSYSVDTFINLLDKTDKAAFQLFLRIHNEVVHSPFSQIHAEDAYVVYAETAKELSKLGYRGIVVLYDEFGTMLSNLINDSEGKGLAVQDFIEKVKQSSTGANILFLAASHQDPTTLQEDKQRDVKKVEGRFVRHHLDVTESEAEEIIGSVFLHPDAPILTKLLDNYVTNVSRQVVLHNLYPEKDEHWIKEKILFNLYPLHPLTSYILPRLSSEFAQNTRSMFNFLSPDEAKEGALVRFLETTDMLAKDGRLQLFTADQLLVFFEKNLAEAKSEQVINWRDSYRTAIRKLNDAPETEQLYRALLLLTVVGGRLNPKKDMLFWALNWPSDKRQDFDNLLNDLVVNEFLEFNPTTQVYEFPMAGSKSVSKIIQEEKQKLVGLSLNDCTGIWDRLEPRPNFDTTEQENNYGANRHFRVIVARKVSNLIEPIESLTKFYQAASDEYKGNGLIFYLVGRKESDIKPLIEVLQQSDFIQSYIFYAVPKDGAGLELLLERTLDFRALEEAINREEIKANSNQLHSVREQLRIEETRLRQAIKDLYHPNKWLWYYGSGANPCEFKSQTSMMDWFNKKVDDLFTSDSVPIVREPALWFKDGEQNYRSKALKMLWESPYGELFLYSSDTKKPADLRILENFFRNLKLTKDMRMVSKTQYGDLKNPESGTPAAVIFRHFDKTFNKDGLFIEPINLIKPLLQKPFGLSRHLALFMLTCYIRANRDQIIICDSKRSLPKEKTAELIESIIKKPKDHRIRKIEMSAPEKRYLDRLRELFEKKTASSFGEVGEQITGLIKFLSPLQRTLINQAKDPDVVSFYDSLEIFNEKISLSGANQDAEAREYFLEVLPDNLLGLNQAEFEDGANSNIDALIEKLRAFKEFPGIEDRKFRLETLSLMTETVFGVTLVGKDDIRNITHEWFKNLPPANRKAIYEQPKINQWIQSIQYGYQGRDILTIYLSDLTDNPIHEWNGNLAVCQSKYVDEFKFYKKTIEDYTQSPLPLYQYIAMTAFSVSPGECDSELTFAGIFESWWNGLTKQVQKHTFQDEGVRVLIEHITSSLPTKSKFLTVIPTLWIDFGCLPSSIPTKWEEWSDIHKKAVAEEYQRCCDIIMGWKPPITETDFFKQIGKVFGFESIENVDSLKSRLYNEWYTALSERTRLAPWVEMNTPEASFMNHLCSNEGFYDFITDELPKLLGQPSLQEMDDDKLLTFCDKISIIKKAIETYRRPVLEVIAALEKNERKRSGSPAEFQLRLNEIVRQTEAFNNEADKDDSLMNKASLPAILLTNIRSKATVENLIKNISEYVEVPSDYHLWTKENQNKFVSMFQKAIKELKSWKFPSDVQMQKAKAQLDLQLQAICASHKLSQAQLRKILNDILAEQTANVEI